MGISTTSQPRAKRKLDRAQPQEEGRHRSCAAPNGASAECPSKTTGSRPWLELYRRYAAKMANLQAAATRLKMTKARLTGQHEFERERSCPNRARRPWHK